MNPKRCAIFLMLIQSLIWLSGCDDSDSSNQPVLERLTEDPISEGNTVVVMVNLDNDDDQAIVAGSLYEDGEKIALVGGDLLQVDSDIESINISPQKDGLTSYYGELTIDDETLSVDMRIGHDVASIDAVDERWYPTDIIDNDPGPGAMVGELGELFFPEIIEMTSPSSLSIFPSLTSDINLTWIASDSEEDIWLSYKSNCSDEADPLANGYGYRIDTRFRDPGAATFRIRDFVDPNRDSGSFGDALDDLFFNLLILPFAVVIDVITFGGIDEDSFFREHGGYDRNNEQCAIELILLRINEHDPIPIAEGGLFDAGGLYGIRSDRTTIFYNRE